MIEGEIRSFLQDIGASANSLGHEVYIVGGYVRNHLFRSFQDDNEYKARHPGGISKPINDIDLVINTDAIEFVYKYQKYYEDNNHDHITFEITNEFKEFGTIKIKHPEFPDHEIEFASTREESYSSPAAFPKVSLIEDIQDDLPRRDFTINALLLSLNSKNFEEIVDYTNGIQDMQNGLVRVFHDESFIDDPTRIYRAFRFALEYGFEIEEHTMNLIKAAAKDERMPEWLKKRKNRFNIELENIKKLGKSKFQEALKQLNELKLIAK